jgi:glyoxylase-like metal-dependent hydrolase (beta-lactamase superfamily II)
MAVWICTACGVEHPETELPPGTCEICADERQYVPSNGQEWTTFDDLAMLGTTISIAAVEPMLFGIRAHPAVGIGPRTHLVQTDASNLLWDPIGYVDEAAAEAVLELGAVAAIVASHPHMFGAQVEWSRALGGVPVLVAYADREWVQREDAAIEFIGPEDVPILPGITIRTVGGHFPGSLIAHWSEGANGKGVLLSGDTMFPTQDGRWVGFMRSYPNTIPLSAAVVDRVASATLTLPFDRLYGNFGMVVPSGARAIIRRSVSARACPEFGCHWGLIVFRPRLRLCRLSQTRRG